MNKTTARWLLVLLAFLTFGALVCAAGFWIALGVVVYTTSLLGSGIILGVLLDKAFP